VRLVPTILYMPTWSKGVEESFRNRAGVSRFLDYRGVEVIEAYGPLEVGGLRWAIAAKQDVTEALHPPPGSSVTYWSPLRRRQSR